MSVEYKIGRKSKTLVKDHTIINIHLYGFYIPEEDFMVHHIGGKYLYYDRKKLIKRDDINKHFLTTIDKLILYI